MDGAANVSNEKIAARASRYAIDPMIAWLGTSPAPGGDGPFNSILELEAKLAAWFADDGLDWARALERHCGVRADAALVGLLEAAAVRAYDETVQEYADRHLVVTPARLKGGGTWHVARVINRTDKHALELLADQEVEAYYPKLQELRPVPRKQLSQRQRAQGLTMSRQIVVPMFPRYVFVRLDLASAWREVFQIAGLGGLISQGGLPVAIDPALIDTLKANEVDGVVPGKTPARLVFAVGDRVLVRDGAFIGYEGLVEKRLDLPIAQLAPDQRIRVAVGFFGRPTSVNLPIVAVEKI